MTFYGLNADLNGLTLGIIPLKSIYKPVLWTLVFQFRSHVTELLLLELFEGLQVLFLFFEVLENFSDQQKTSFQVHLEVHV